MALLAADGRFAAGREHYANRGASIGESVAAGAIFTIPAFVLSGAWPSFDFGVAIGNSTVLMMVGGVPAFSS